MNNPNNQEAHDQQILIEDLWVNNDQAAEVKGGPIEVRELHIKVNVNPE